MPVWLQRGEDQGQQRTRTDFPAPLSPVMALKPGPRWIVCRSTRAKSAMLSSLRKAVVLGCSLAAAEELHRSCVCLLGLCRAAGNGGHLKLMALHLMLDGTSEQYS